MPRPAPITVYRALDFLMANGLVHRIESRNAYLACAHDHDAAALVAFLICERCGSVGEIPAAPVAQSSFRRGACFGLCAKTLRRRNHRHLRALPEGGVSWMMSVNSSIGALTSPLPLAGRSHRIERCDAGGGSLHSMNASRGDTLTPTLPRRRGRGRTFSAVAAPHNNNTAIKPALTRIDALQ